MEAMVDDLTDAKEPDPEAEILAPKAPIESTLRRTAPSFVPGMMWEGAQQSFFTD